MYSTYFLGRKGTLRRTWLVIYWNFCQDRIEYRGHVYKFRYFYFSFCTSRTNTGLCVKLLVYFCSMVMGFVSSNADNHGLDPSTIKSMTGK